MLKIEKNVPVPSQRKGKYNVVRDTMKALEIGDSFLFPFALASSKDPRQTAVSVVTHRAKQFGIRVSVRQEKDGVRVWRTA